MEFVREGELPGVSLTRLFCVSGMHHHKQVYHHRGREGQDEAGSRSQPNFMWNGDPGRSRNYADCAGGGTLEGVGYRSALVLLCTVYSHLDVL